MKKSRKVIFYDNGIRNANIANERYASTWFWRTTQQQEIDYLEEQDGRIDAFEFKWNPKAKQKWPKTFTDHYPNHSLTVVNRETYGTFLR